MLCNQSSRFYCDSDEVAGLIRLMPTSRRAAPTRRNAPPYRAR